VSSDRLLQLVFEIFSQILPSGVSVNASISGRCGAFRVSSLTDANNFLATEVKDAPVIRSTVE
jgi:hypothetical protein